MLGFESVSSAPTEKELSPEDKAVMSRRTFLKVAGAAAAGAVLEALPSESQAETGGDLFFERGVVVTEFDKKAIAKTLNTLASGAAAQFQYMPPDELEVYTIIATISLPDGSIKEGRMAGFPGSPHGKACRDALLKAFGKY
ncbi:MAG: twin-arginine translocation signal domain-containing protein [Candidatus Moraniibacteriota bacterium]|nr:MAG: twin-arginine translocation signal domain-containing protein [Candidatus Moranbacteria bacterium]